MTGAAFDPDFDHVYVITRDGAISDAPDTRALWAPDVSHSDSTDVEIMGEGWACLTGHTGQHGYSGAVMHPSELWGAWAVEDLTRIADDDTLAGVAFVVVEVSDEDGTYPDGDPIGWAVAYRGVAL